MSEITEEQGKLCTRTLAAVAWADGQLKESEMERIVDLVIKFDYVDPSLVQEILYSQTAFTFLDRVKALPRALRIRLLHDAYMVAQEEDSVGEAEMAVIREVAGTIVKVERWSEVEACLQAYVAYEQRCRPLWGITHLG